MSTAGPGAAPARNGETRGRLAKDVTTMANKPPKKPAKPMPKPGKGKC